MLALADLNPAYIDEELLTSAVGIFACCFRECQRMYSRFVFMPPVYHLLLVMPEAFRPSNVAGDTIPIEKHVHILELPRSYSEYNMQATAGGVMHFTAPCCSSAQAPGSRLAGSYIGSPSVLVT